jgi:hypothetical protein
MREESYMKSKLAHSAFVIASLLALTHFATAQGPSGATARQE